MKKLLYLGLLSVCVLLGSCVEKNVFNAFDKVERYMDVYSDSALLLLEQIPHPEKLRGKQRADYVLLLTQARDKNYLDSMQSDSLIKLAVDYYKNGGDNVKAGKALFYYGKVMDLQGNDTLFQHKNRQEKEDTDDGHHQSANGTRRQWKPESFLVLTYHERDKSQNGRNYREENRNDLRIPRLDVGTKSGKTGETTSDAVVLVQDIDAGIHRDAAQQDERGKTALVEVQPEPIESKKYPDIRNRNHKDDGKRLLQGVEQNAGRKEDDGYHHQQKQVLAVVLLAP